MFEYLVRLLYLNHDLTDLPTEYAELLKFDILINDRPIPKLSDTVLRRYERFKAHGNSNL